MCGLKTILSISPSGYTRWFFMNTLPKIIQVCTLKDDFFGVLIRTCGNDGRYWKIWPMIIVTWNITNILNITIPVNFLWQYINTEIMNTVTDATKFLNCNFYDIDDNIIIAIFQYWKIPSISIIALLNIVFSQ